MIQFINYTVINHHGGSRIAAEILFYELYAMFANRFHFGGVDFLNNSSPILVVEHIFSLVVPRAVRQLKIQSLFQIVAGVLTMQLLEQLCY